VLSLINEANEGHLQDQYNLVLLEKKSERMKSIEEGQPMGSLEEGVPKLGSATTRNEDDLKI